MLAGLDRSIRLAEQMLAYSRATAARGALSLEPVALRQVVDDALEDVLPRIKEHALKLTLDSDPPVAEMPVRGDRDKLASLVRNLLDNAVRHGGPPVTMGGQVRDGEVELRVTDEGRGVPDELVPRLFDRFAAAGATSGTGLGLYLVREIARGHGGGAVYLPPTEGDPTTFLIRFPMAAAGR